VTTIEESKDLEEMKIEELVGSLQTYEYSLPPVRKVKTIALKASKVGLAIFDTTREPGTNTTRKTGFEFNIIGFGL
jgi:hypothetical protein